MRERNIVFLCDVVVQSVVKVEERKEKEKSDGTCFRHSDKLHY